MLGSSPVGQERMIGMFSSWRSCTTSGKRDFIADSHLTLLAFVTITTVSLHFFALFKVFRMKGVNLFDVRRSNSPRIACKQSHVCIGLFGLG